MSSIDRVFSFYIVAYIGFFFLGIIYHVSQLVDIFQTGGVENVRFLYVFGISALMSFLLFYGLKEFSDCSEHSSACKSILYEYVLSSNPDERSTAFFQEVRFLGCDCIKLSAMFTFPSLSSGQLCNTGFAQQACHLHAFWSNQPQQKFSRSHGFGHLFLCGSISPIYSKTQVATSPPRKINRLKAKVKRAKSLPTPYWQLAVSSAAGGVLLGSFLCLLKTL